ncbi:hypothetical protein ACEWY4_019575 [Coilia grayii]|uniref:SNTX thioredoxin-like domain-containing protein n=1 Tax=Coilia grayii TaxID=363190 RepID=A0ABD1JAA8_9TELE
MAFLTGLKLWDDADMQKVMKVKGQQNTSFNVTASDSFSKKSKLLDVKARLRASFLSGLVSVEGSAHYLKDTTTSMHQCRVTLQYKETTVFKELMTLEMEIKHPEVFEKNEATHVVTAVLYGAEAYMVFDQMVADIQKKQEILGELKVEVNKIPGVSISGEGKVVINDDERRKVKQFKCTFHGDFKLKQNPASYEEAAIVYKSLPTMLGQKGEAAVPLKVWLYPLKNINPKAAQLVRDINTTLVSAFECVMDDLHKAKIRVHDLIKMSNVIPLAEITGKLVTFQTKLAGYTMVLKRKVLEVLPEIRGGTVAETAFEDILKFHHHSSFTKQSMTEWLDEKETEMGLVSSYIHLMKGIPVVPPGPRLHKILYHPKLDVVAMFSFTSLVYAEPYLTNLEECLSCEEFQKMADVKVATQKSFVRNTVPWYEHPETIPAMRACLTHFFVVKGRCDKNSLHTALISFVSDTSYLGSSIRVYRNGACINPHYKPPNTQKQSGRAIVDDGCTNANGDHSPEEDQFRQNPIADRHAELYLVPPGRVEEESQNTSTETSVTKVMHSDRQIAALGRPLHPGMLYNARNDTFIPGVTLWSDEDMKKVMKIRGHQNTSFDVTASDSMKKKTKLLDISATLKCSFLAGLVTLEGSASFLDDRLSSSRQCRVTMQYRETTLFKELVATDMEVKHPEIFGKNEATHVVTAVLYGAEAFLVFDQMAADYQERKEVKGALKAMIGRIPLLQLTGEGKVAMTEEDKRRARRFSCKFHGDFKLKENPSSFEEAVIVYKRLPSLLGQKGEAAVPMKVWLYPLSNLEPKAAKLVRDINASAVAILEAIIEHLHDAKMRAHDLIKLSKNMNLTVLRDKLETFQNKRAEYGIILKRKLKGVLPEIRGGTVPETALTDILRFHEASPFSKIKMRDWLNEKETEVTIVQSYLSLLGSTSLVPPGPQLDRVLYDPKLNTVVMFSFTSLEYPEPYLSTIEECLNCEDFTKMADVKVAMEKMASKNTVPWYKYPGAIPALRSCSPLFLVVKARCMRNPLHSALISYVPDDSHPGCSLRVYRNGQCINPHLKPPEKHEEGEPTADKAAGVMSNRREEEITEEEDDPLCLDDQRTNKRMQTSDGKPWDNGQSFTRPEDAYTTIDGKVGNPQNVIIV